MPPPVVSVLAYLFVAVLGGAVIGMSVNVWAGWACFSGALLLQLLYHLRHFLRLERWSRQPAATQELLGIGAWDTVFSRLYRQQRAMRSEIDDARRTAMRYVAAGQALIDGLISLDASGRIEWINASAEELLGLSRRSDIGQTLANLVRNPEFVAFLRQGDFRQPLELPSPLDNEQALSIHIVRYGGNRRLLQIRDVTQRERIDQMRRDFVANVSHELRTPLTVLAGFIETLRDLETDLTANERQRYLGLMVEQSGRMQRLLEELLVLSNLESAPLPPPNGRVDMSALTEKLRRDAEALSAGRHEILLDCQGDGDLLGSEMEISSALSNLVSNAIRYTPQNGQVTLRWQVDAQGAEFAVEDTGIGIEPKHIPRLTERFYRVDRGRSRETGGTGLGLAIVKHALSRHQATLDIQSEPGKGSRFAARFPPTRVAV